MAISPQTHWPESMKEKEQAPNSQVTHSVSRAQGGSKSVIDVAFKLHQKDVIARIRDLDFDFRSVPAPYVVELDPTAACDLACPGCISEDIIARGGRFSDERLLNLGRELIEAGVRAVILIGGGEPLAHPKISDLIHLLGEGGIEIGLTTNGTFIDRHIEHIAQYCFWTRISVDAASEEMFNTLRPAKGRKSKWEHVLHKYY